MSKSKRAMINRTRLASGVEGGVEWFTLKGPFGINGYVVLPNGHPWASLDGWDIPVEVHGGITYGPDEDGVIGFDTAHAGDAWDGPTGFSALGIGGHRWTADEVIDETRILARQVSAPTEPQEPATAPESGDPL